MIACPWKGVFQWPVDVNDPSKGWITEADEAAEGEEDLSDLVGPHPGDSSKGAPNLQEENPDVELDDNPVLPSEGTAAASTSAETRASEEEPIADVGGNTAEDASLDHSLELRID